MNLYHSLTTHPNNAYFPEIMMHASSKKVAQQRFYPGDDSKPRYSSRERKRKSE